MMGLNFLTIGDISSADYGIFLSGEGSFQAPRRSYQEITIPGRNGTLTIDDDRMENVPVEYKMIIVNTFPADYSGFRNALLSLRGYQRIEDTFHPDEYRMGLFRDGIEPKTYGLRNESGKFELDFDCKPQRWLKSGEKPIELSGNGVIYNETLFDAKPLIRVYGNGVLGVGEETITIFGVNGYIDIDSEVEDAYQGDANLNSNIVLSSGEFPVLRPGENGVTLGSGITRVIITPRWWIV